MNWIVLVIMVGIMVISIVAGRGGELRDDPHSDIAWVILFIGAGVAEVYLIVVRDHTLSNQMQFWAREGWRGQVAIIFWAWFGYHIIIEPLIRRAMAR